MEAESEEYQQHELQMKPGAPKKKRDYKREGPKLRKLGLTVQADTCNTSTQVSEGAKYE